MTHIDKYLCICDDEMCYCSELVPTNPEACNQCARGWHVLFPGLVDRGTKVTRPRTIVVSGDPYPDEPIDIGTTREEWVMLGVALVAFIVIVIALGVWAVQ